MSAARAQRAKDVELILRCEERLKTMQAMLESLDAESTKAALKALSIDDGPEGGVAGVEWEAEFAAKPKGKPSKNGK